MKPAADRMQHFAPHFFAALAARVETLRREGRDIIRLDEGSPDLPPAAHITAALADAAANPAHHSYQTHRGPALLRQAWAEMYRRDYGVELDPEREILPLLGSKEGIFHFSAAFINPGDPVLIPDPGYITYTRGALLAGGQPVYLPLRPHNRYLPDFEDISPETASQAKLLWLNYPNNPTGAVAPLDFFARAVEFARRHNILLCHDSAYARVTYDGWRAPSVLEVPGAKDVAVEFNSLSKSHNMAGWRVGALVGSPEAVRIFHTFKTNVDSGHFYPILAAAARAMTGPQDWLIERNEIYRMRRDVLVAGLRGLGLAVEPPLASLYIWAPVPAGWTSLDFTNLALERAGVSLTPGTVFGQNGEGFVRLSLTAPLERVQTAVDRLGELNKWL